MAVSSQEQLMIELVNRLRLDPQSEVIRLGITDTDVIDSMLAASGKLMALAGNSYLEAAAAAHSEWILSADKLSHTGVDGTNGYDRIVDAGYDFSGFWTWGENISYRGSTGELDITRAVHYIYEGYLNSAGHRGNMLNLYYSEIGVGQEMGDFLGYNATSITQNFATSNSQYYLTGVAYNDLDGDGFYSVGEAVEGVTFAAEGSSAMTHAAGGYSSAIGAGASRLVSITRPDGHEITVQVWSSDENVKLDLVDGDTVMSSASLALVAGQANAALLGTLDTDLTGNAHNNVLTGNSSDNVFATGLGNDTVHGGAGHDTAMFDFAASAASFRYMDNGVSITSADGVDFFEGVEEFVFNSQSVAFDALPTVLAETQIASAGASNGGAEGSDTVTSKHATVLLSADGRDVLLGDTLSASDLPPLSAAIFRLYQSALDRTPDTAGHAAWAAELFSGSMSLSQIAEGFVGSAEFQKVYGTLDDAGFIELLYQNVLGRSADAGGMEGWLNAMANGASRADILVGLSESAELKTVSHAAAQVFTQEHTAAGWSDDVFRLYKATLDRAPDLAGFLSWSEALANGQSFDEVVSSFVSSAEFQKVYGELSDTAFVELLYANVLERAPDPSETAAWLELIDNGMARETVVVGFAQSLETMARTGVELASWVRARGEHDVLDGGAGENELMGGILSDTFVFDRSDAGKHTVYDLEMWDALKFEGFGYANANDAMMQLQQVGSDVLFEDQGTQVTFADVHLADFDAGMFIF